MIEDSVYFKKGDIVSLKIADNSSFPFFINEKVVRDGYSKGCAMYLSSVKKISKLKPAKQALANAIHQNGGWDKSLEWNFSTCDRFGVISFWDEKPAISNHYSLRDWRGESRLNLALINALPNWHQTILSRDEYFTAHPEQVKVEVNSETEHKVEAEMKSESEMEIKVSDWHKKGELPPVGEAVEVYLDDGREFWHKAYVVGYSLPKGSLIAASLTEKNDKLIWSNQFRQPRTERDMAIDAMKEACPYHGCWDNVGRIYAEALYDAGYRKEVK